MTRVIHNFPSYKVDEDGDVYRCSYVDWGNKAKYNGEHKLNPATDRYGYLKVCLCEKGVRRYVTVHRLVAETFIPNPNSLPTVNHKNGNKKDNRVCNLEWVTNKENTHHAFLTGLHKGCRTSVTLSKDDKTITFESITEAAFYLKHDRHCFDRHLDNNPNEGIIDGWHFKLKGGKTRTLQKVVLPNG
jgi:hypothetical protein